MNCLVPLQSNDSPLDDLLINMEIPDEFNGINYGLRLQKEMAYLQMLDNVLLACQFGSRKNEQSIVQI